MTKGLHLYRCPICGFEIEINYTQLFIQFIHMGCKNERLMRQDDV